MKRFLRRISRVADSSQYRPLRPGKAAHAAKRWIFRRRRTPEGHVPVYVGDEMERFAVPADLLGRPAFVELLQRSAQEYGYEQRGVLRIPCSVPVFRRVLISLSEDADPAVDELFWSSSDEIRATTALIVP